MGFGLNIKKIRTNKGLTQKQLAELLNVATITIQNYESGRREPNYDMLSKLSEVLSVPLVELFIDDTSSLSTEKIFYNTETQKTTTDYASGDYKKNVSSIDAFNALNTLLAYSNYDLSLKGKELELLLNKVTDLLEFELFNIKKSRGIEIK